MKGCIGSLCLHRLSRLRPVLQRLVLIAGQSVESRPLTPRLLLHQTGLGEGEPDLFGGGAIRLHILPFNGADVHASARVGRKRQKLAWRPGQGRCLARDFCCRRFGRTRGACSFRRGRSRRLDWRLSRGRDGRAFRGDERRGPGRWYWRCRARPRLAF
jgi:hypothetical protein